jgi:hypothetical protein
MEKFAEQVTQQLANDISNAVTIKLAASPVLSGLGLGILQGSNGALGGLIHGGLLGAGTGALLNLGNDDQSWDSYRAALLNGAKWGGGIGAGLGGLVGATAGGLGGYQIGKLAQEL